MTGIEDAAADAPADVVIAVEHPVIREAVRRSCDATPGLVVQAEARDGDDLIAICQASQPTVIVLDDGFSDDRGLELLRAIREAGGSSAVLMLTDRTDGASVLDALKLGVRGYVGKADGLRDVGPATRRIAAGERLIDPELEQAAVMALGAFAKQAREGSEVQAVLTPREREILVMVSHGFTMQQVGKRLGISPRTVETHVAKLYRKLGVRTRVQAVSRAAALGLIEL
jgi:DNA-binding NarL/FixJ family response regulator